MLGRLPVEALDVALLEDRETTRPILPNGLDERQTAASRPSSKLNSISVFAPFWNIGDQVDREKTTWPHDSCHRRQCGHQIFLPNQRLQDAIRSQNRVEATGVERKRSNICPHEHHSAARSPLRQQLR